MAKEEGNFAHVLRLRVGKRIVIGRGTGNTPVQALSSAVDDMLPFFRGRKRRELLLMRLAAHDPELLAELWETRRF